jgi:hypothetical protein
VSKLGENCLAAPAERSHNPRADVVVHEAKQRRRWRFSALDQPRTDQLGQYPRCLCRTGTGEKGDRAQIEVGSALREDGEYSTLRTWDDALHGSAKVHASVGRLVGGRPGSSGARRRSCPVTIEPAPAAAWSTPLLLLGDLPWRQAHSGVWAAEGREMRVRGKKSPQLIQ